MILRDRDVDGDTSTLEERTYALYDGQLNTTAIMNASGAVIERYSTDPFGGNVKVYNANGSLLSTSSSGATRDIQIGSYYLGTSHDWTYFGGGGRLNQITGLYVASGAASGGGGAFNPEINQVLASSAVNLRSGVDYTGWNQLSWLEQSSTYIVEGAHLGLDLMGMVPLLGALADLANAGIYAYEGRWAESGFSAFAALPGLGDSPVQLSAFIQTRLH